MAKPRSGDPQVAKTVTLGSDTTKLPLPQQVLAIPSHEHYSLVSRHKLMTLGETGRDHFGDAMWWAIGTIIAAGTTALDVMDKIGDGDPVQGGDLWQFVVVLIAIPVLAISAWIYLRRGHRREDLLKEMMNAPQFVSDGSGGLVPLQQAARIDGTSTASRN